MFEIGLIWLTMSLNLYHQTLAERWSNQLQRFLPHQINDWMPLHPESDRSLRYASFPNQYGESSVVPHPEALRFSNSFNKFSFGTQVQADSRLQQVSSQIPVAQPLVRQSSHLSQHLQSGDKDNDVQLLYVPLDTIHQQRLEKQNNRFNGLAQNVNAALINNFYESGADSHVTRFSSPITTTTTRPITTVKPEYITNKEYGQTDKLKPYQPPLAIFQFGNGKQSSLNDVLMQLKTASTIDVLDSPTDRKPTVFIGPNDMPAPIGYSKFELPYLSSVDWGRTGRRIDNLPFFVAPLSYNTPPGFAKIPLPAPHVGSVVVNTPLEKSEGKIAHSDFINSAAKPYRINSENHSTTIPNTYDGKAHSVFTHREVPQSQTLSEEAFHRNRQPSTRHPTSAQIPLTRYSGELGRVQVTSNQQLVDNFSHLNQELTTLPESPSSTTTYQTKPKISSQLFGFDTTVAPNFFSPLEENNGDALNQFVHKFKLVDSVKPNYKATKEPEYFTYNANAFGTNNAFFSPQINKPSPQPSISNYDIQQTTESSVFESSINNNNGFSRFSLFPSSTIKTPYETTSSMNVYTPTTFVTTDGTQINVNGKSPAKIHSQNFLAQTETVTEKDHSDSHRGHSKASSVEKSANTLTLENVSRLQPRPSINTHLDGEINNEGQSESNIDALLRDKNIRNQFTEAEGSFELSKKNLHHPTAKVHLTSRPKFESRPSYTSPTTVLPSAEILNEPILKSERTSKYNYGQGKHAQVESARHTGRVHSIETTTVINLQLPPVTENIASDIPSISPMLPGLINSLMEEKWVQPSEVVNDAVVATTRRSLRERKPQSNTQTVNVIAEQKRSRRPPVNLKKNTNEEKILVPTTTSINRERFTVRNPNRVRYNPTPEERQRLRSRGRATTIKSITNIETDLEYQRDVLNQNYPSVKPILHLQSNITKDDVESSFIYTNSTTHSMESSTTVKNKLFGHFPLNHATNYRDDLDDKKDSKVPQEPTMTIGIHDELKASQLQFTTLDKGLLEPTENINKFNHNRVLTTTKHPHTVTTTELPATTTIVNRQRKQHGRRTTKAFIVTTTDVSDVPEESTPKPRGRLRLKSRPIAFTTTSPELSSLSNIKGVKSLVTVTNRPRQGSARINYRSENQSSYTTTTGKESSINVTEPDLQDQETTEFESKPNETIDLFAKTTKRRGYWKKVRVRPVDTFETAESQHISNHYLNVLIPQSKLLQKQSKDSAYNIAGSEGLIANQTNENIPKVSIYVQSIEKLTNKQNYPSSSNSSENQVNEEIKEKKLQVELIKRPVEVISWNRNESPTISQFQFSKDDFQNNNSSEEEEQATIIPETTTLKSHKDDDQSMFDEVKKSLSDLFSMENDNIEATDLQYPLESEGYSTQEPKDTTTTSTIIESEGVSNEAEPTIPTTIASLGNIVGFPTSTSKYMSLETEICYRGKCIKTEKHR